MMRALFSGVTGLRSHQTRMDVIGNNIANVNTMGYKKMTTTFKDLYNETISSAASTSGVGATATGGVNAKQIGLGAAVGAISAIHTPGSAQYTGHGMDVAISGDGYFAVLTPTGIKYTRAGEFATDLQGNFVTKEGYYVLTVEPRVSASESLKVPENGVHVNTLINQLKGIQGAAHTGNITADLAEVEGSSFTVEFEEGEEPWSVRYVGDTTDTYYPNSPLSVVSENGTSKLDVVAISNVLKDLAANPNEAMKIGTNEITFAFDDTGVKANGSVKLDFGGKTFSAGDRLSLTLADGTVMTASAANVGGELTWNISGAPAGYTAELSKEGVLSLTANDTGRETTVYISGDVTANEMVSGSVAGTAAVAGADSATITLGDATLDGTTAAYSPDSNDTLTFTLTDKATSTIYTITATTADGAVWTFGGDAGKLPADLTLTGNGSTITIASANPTATPVSNYVADGAVAVDLDRPVEYKAEPDSESWVAGDDAGINMMYGDKVIATTDSGPATANRNNEYAFTAADGTALGSITINPNEDLNSEAVVDNVLNKMNSKPMLTLEENGQWVIKRDGVTVEKIVMEYSDNVNGGILGDVQFNTSSYGSILLDVQADGNGNIMPNQQALSDALSGNSFTIDVETEYLPNYTIPAIITADSLQTLQIDFDRYTNVSIDTTGAILGQLKNDEQWEIDGQTVNMEAGDKAVLGYISMATFNNPSGLEKVGDNMFEVSANSGNPVYGTPGNGSAGSLAPSNLEMSNVDLSEEMVNMIITQRGFQANSRIITTTDTMLEELVNLKR